jgi:hypothetical protein
MVQKTILTAVRIANSATYNLEDPSFANIAEFADDNRVVFETTTNDMRLAAQVRQVIKNGADW